MVSYEFYINEYKGSSISAASFPRLSMVAKAQLSQYKRLYTVTGNEVDESMAACAMADALYYFEIAANGGITTSVSVGSVTSSKSATQLPDTSAGAQAAELYRCAQLYLDIYRG